MTHMGVHPTSTKCEKTNFPEVWSPLIPLQPLTSLCAKLKIKKQGHQTEPVLSSLFCNLRFLLLLVIICDLIEAHTECAIISDYSSIHTCHVRCLRWGEYAEHEFNLKTLYVHSQRFYSQYNVLACGEGAVQSLPVCLVKLLHTTSVCLDDFILHLSG